MGSTKDIKDYEIRFGRRTSKDADEVVLKENHDDDKAERHCLTISVCNCSEKSKHFGAESYFPVPEQNNDNFYNTSFLEPYHIYKDVELIFLKRWKRVGCI